MPVVRTLLDINDVISILSRRGYGVNRNNQFDLQLSVAGPRKYQSGSFERILMKGLSRTEVKAVLEKAESHEEAAIMFEALSKGERVSAIEEMDETTASTGLSAQDIATIIDNRVANEVARALTPVMRDLEIMRAEIAKLRQTEPVPTKKIKKGKLPTHDETEALLASMNIPKTLPTPA